MAAGDNRIRIEVQGESGDLQAALARSRQAIRGVGDESDRQTTRAGRVFDRLRAKLRRPIEAKARVNVEGLAALEGARSRVRSFGRESAQASAGVGRLDGAVRTTAHRAGSTRARGGRLMAAPTRGGHLTVLNGGEEVALISGLGEAREALEALEAVTSEWAAQLPADSQIRSIFLQLRNSSARLLRLEDEVLARQVLRPAEGGG